MKYDYYYQKLEALWRRRKWWVVGVFSLIVVAWIASRLYDPKPKTPTETLNQSILSYIQALSHDPKSYEPLETEFVDTVFFLKSVPRMIGSQKENISRLQESLISDSLMLIEYRREGFQSLVSSTQGFLAITEIRIKREQSYLTRLQKVVDSVSKAPDPNPILCYIAKHRCRLKNAMGALNLTEYYVQTDASLNILKFEEKLDNLYTEEALLYIKPLGILPVKK